VKLQVGLPDINAARIQANTVEDRAAKETILTLCTIVDALIRNLEAMTDDTNKDLNERVFSVQDMLDRSVIKTYEIRGQGNTTVGPFRRRS
jgi:hypothetical protein